MFPVSTESSACVSGSISWLLACRTVSFSGLVGAGVGVLDGADVGVVLELP